MVHRLRGGTAAISPCALRKACSHAHCALAALGRNVLCAAACLAQGSIELPGGAVST